MKGLIRQAKEILNNNYLHHFTKPAPSLYPYQWNWDSGFIAMAYAHYDLEKAGIELQSLFKGQWSNGMLPQIIFHTLSDLYFPGPDFWQTESAEFVSTQVPTSGITMPPVHGFVLKYIYDHAENKTQALGLVHSLWDKVFLLHQYLYSNRDPHHEGLPYIIHPWEPGTDNSPILDSVLERIDLTSIDIPDYQRKDLQSTDAKDHRPQKKDYDRYVYLVDLYRKCNYDDQKIFEVTPFAVQDPLFCGILSRSNKDLITLGQLIGKNTQQLEAWDQLTTLSMNNKLWDDRGIYNAYDLKADQKIEVYSHSGFIPLFAQIPSTEKALQMKEYLLSPSFVGEEDHPTYLCPSHALDHPDHDSIRYWRGPIWLNINWMLAEGAKYYQMYSLSDRIIQDSITLVREKGFYEYFDPYKNSKLTTGCGTDNFSWTAAMTILFLHKEQ